MLRLLVLGALTWLATDLGFASFRPEFGTAMIWPLPGVALLWAATGTRRTRPLDAVVLLLVTAGALVLAGGTPGQGVVGGLQAVVQGGVFLVVVRRLVPDLWGGGGTRPMTRLADLGAFLLAAVVAALAATVLRGLGLGLIPVPEWTDNALVWVRNFCGMVTIGGLALLVGPLLQQGRSLDQVRRLARSWWGRWPARWPESSVVVVVSVGSFAAVLAQREPLPISFLLVLPALWAGLRTNPVLATTLTVVLGTGVLVATVDDRGIFAAMADPRLGALVAQGLVVATLAVSLAVSLVGSERLLLAAEATERATLLSAILEQIREGLMVVRADGTVALHNPALAGLPDAGGSARPGEVIDVPPVRDLEGREVPREAQPLARALGGEVVVGEQLVVQGRDGTTHTLEISAVPLPGGDQPQAVVTMRDVTALRQREDDLAAFAGVVAHDLSTPLSVVTGWVDALEDHLALEPLDAESGALYTGRIRASAGQMRGFIDDLLGYTVARDHPFESEAIDLSRLAEEVADVRREAPGHPRITVEPGIRVQGDRVLLRQLLDNLVGNAVKYVAVGTRPEVVVRGRPVADDPATVEVRVEDNGVGVPESQRTRIFETFVRAHGSQFSGTGLGLGIVTRVVDRHGGAIRVETGPGGTGSSFVLELPAVAVDRD